MNDNISIILIYYIFNPFIKKIPNYELYMYKSKVF